MDNIIVNGCEFYSSPLGPPNYPGVYMVVAYSPIKQKRLVLYIGSSKNINTRVNRPNHPYRILYKRLKKFWVVTESYITDDYIKLEQQAIQQIQPILNVQYKLKRWPIGF